MTVSRWPCSDLCRSNTLKIQIKLASEVPRRSGGLPSVWVRCWENTEAFSEGVPLAWRHHANAIREIHGIREGDEVEELLLFSDQDKKRKKYLEDLWRDRSRQVQLRCEGGTWRLEWWGVKKEELTSPSAIANARLGATSDLEFGCEMWRISWRWWNIWRIQKLVCWGL